MDGTAAATLREVRLDGHDAPSPFLVAKRLGVRVMRGPIVGGRLGQLCYANGEFVVRLRRGQGEQLELFSLAHELGHVAARRYDVRLDDEEAFANTYAGELLVPPESLRTVWRRGEDVNDVVERWAHVPATCCALRVGEEGLAALYVVQGKAVRYTRADAAAPREAIEVAGEAVRQGRGERPGLRAVKLPDGVKRAAVAVREVG